jgi:hypothetical protein
MASLALAAAAGPARATTQTALPKSPAAIGAPRAINSSGTPVGTQRLERPDQVPNGIAAPDWARIWAQVEADEYAIRSAREPLGSAQYEAWNPQEQLHAEFAREGISVAGRAEAGQAGPWARLVLKGYGYGQQLQEALPPALVASGNRIEYRRGTLTEWYVNQRHGVEQGFTLAERPTGLGDQGPLRLELAIEGTLRGELSPDGQAVVLRDGSGGEWMRYSGLKAWDARHQELVAKLEASDGVIALVVEASEAVYPVTIDPVITLTETRRLAPLAVGVNGFGVSVAISGDTVVVGAWAKNFDTGAAYVFERNQGGTNNWGQVMELAASDAAASDYFGAAVSISGDTVVVGASGVTNDTGAAYVFERNQGGANNWGQVKELVGSDSADVGIFGVAVSISGDTVVVGGALEAYVFDRNQGGTNNWGQVQILTASAAAVNDGFTGFGYSVSISEDTVVVGAYDKNFGTGAAYVFERNQGGSNNWGQVKELTASDAAGFDNFGIAVANSGDTVVVGAYGKTNYAGAAYVFDRNQGGSNNWGQVKELAASDSARGVGFGISVAISTNTVVVGAWQKNSNAGAAYVFERNQGGTDNWGQVQELAASDAASGDFFGTCVSISGDTVVVGNEPLYNTGAAYVFDRNQGGTNNWGQVQKLAAGDAAQGDQFGYWVSISGDTAVVGAWGKNSVTGAAYVFDRNQGGANNWGQVQKLAASDAAEGDQFGVSVAISGDTVVVGANAQNTNTGAAYVFDRNQGGANNWGQVQKLAASDAAAFDQFGITVSISGDTVVVGANGKTNSTGAAYVFDRNQGGTNNWGQVKELTASDAAERDQFGFWASISGDTAVVGAWGKNSVTGAAYVFERNQGGANNWGQVQKLAASDAAAGDGFGVSVSISGDTVAVGAYGKNSSAGAAYVFDRNQGGTSNWGQVQELAATDAAVDDAFGIAVSNSGDTVVVGAYGKNSFSGAAYVFDRNQGGTNNWGQVQKLVASNAAAFDWFGVAVAISGDTVVVGASQKSSITGTAYVFDLAAPTTTTANSPSGQYSDKVTLKATVSPDTASGTAQFLVNGSAVGSPVTVSGGVATYDYTIGMPVKPGGYSVEAQFTSTDPRYQNCTGTGTLTVNRENATVTPRSNNPLAVKVSTAGGTAASITLVANISEVADGSLGNIAKAVPVTFTLSPLAGGSTIIKVATVSGSGTGPLVASVTLTNVPVNVYDVSISIGGNYYTGSAETCLAVYDPSLGYVTGGGTVMHEGAAANFAFNAKYVKGGQLQGSLFYIEHRLSGDVVLKSNAMGALAIVGNKAVLTGKATLAGVGNYKFQATVVDNGDPGSSDQFGLQVTDPSGAVVTSLTFDPLTLSAGNIAVPHK